MNHLLNFNIFNLRIDEAKIRQHFTDRYRLRIIDKLEFVSGVEELNEKELDFAKNQIKSYIESCIQKLKNFDMGDYKKFSSHFTIFSFGDIILKKGERYFYPTFRVPGITEEEKEDKIRRFGSVTTESFYSGSIFYTVIEGEWLQTLLLAPRLCKYDPNNPEGPCKDPLDRNEVMSKSKRAAYKRKNNSDNFTIDFFDESFPNNKELSQEVKIIEIPEKIDDTKKLYGIPIRIGGYISFLNKDGLPIKRMISDYKKIVENDKLLGIIIFYNTKDPDGNIKTLRKILVSKDADREGTELLVQDDKTSAEVLSEVVHIIIHKPESIHLMLKRKDVD